MVAVSRPPVLLALFVITSSALGRATTIQLLTLLPSGDQNSTADWDKGQEHLPGADLALKIINQRPDVLPGYQLELIYAYTDTCTETLPMGGLVSFYQHAIDDQGLNSTVVGVVGVLCPPLVKFISPVADLDNVDLIQVSAGPGSPPFKISNDGYSRLYRVISSTAVYNKALIALMSEFNWRKMAIVRDSVNIYYTGTTDDFTEVINATASGITVSFHGAISPTFIAPTLDNVKLTESRIIYASVTEDEAATVMCQAYHNNLLWPGYVWLFHDRTIQDFTSRNTECSLDVMIKALEGVFFIRFRLETPDPNIKMISGQTFVQFQQELNNGPQWRNNSYAYALHDAVWSFALALNMTLANGNSLNGYYLGNNDYTEMLARELNNLSFRGALGRIDFDEKEREATTPTVDIFQVSNGEEIHVGYYNSSTDSITFENRPPEVPEDEFEEKYEQLNVGLRVTVIVIAAIFIAVTTVILVLFIYYRDIEEIRATSLLLSLLIFAGCYLLYFAAIILASREFVADDETAFSALCNIEVWFAIIGLELIFSVLFVRLLRVYRIFFDYDKVGKLWTDQSLFIMALLIVLGSVVLLVIWVAVDPLKQAEDRDYHPETNPPFYEVMQHCSSDNIVVWLTLLLVYSGVLIAVVLVLAIKTRKVKMESFKDTKKVNAYIYITVAVLGLCMPLALIFTVTQVQAAAHIFQSSAFIITAALCKVFLFAPKIWSGVVEVKLVTEKTKKSSNSTSGPTAITQPSAVIPLRKKSFPASSSS